MGFEPVHVRARFDGQVLVTETPIGAPAGTMFHLRTTEETRPNPKPTFGSAKGKIHMTDDFDDPLEDFAEYT